MGKFVKTGSSVGRPINARRGGRGPAVTLIPISLWPSSWPLSSPGPRSSVTSSTRSRTIGNGPLSRPSTSKIPLGQEVFRELCRDARREEQGPQEDERRQGVPRQRRLDQTAHHQEPYWSRHVGQPQEPDGRQRQRLEPVLHAGSGAKSEYGDVPFLAQCVADMNTLRKPHLCVADATEFFLTSGPAGPGELRKLGLGHSRDASGGRGCLRRPLRRSEGVRFLMITKSAEWGSVSSTYRSSRSGKSPPNPSPQPRRTHDQIQQDPGGRDRGRDLRLFSFSVWGIGQSQRTAGARPGPIDPQRAQDQDT